VPSGADDVALLHYPSGSMVNSPADMGKILLMQLNGGKVGEAQILSEEIIQEMQRQHFTQRPQMPGVAYGFFEYFANGRRILFHTGASGHQSLLCLFPEEKIGFYIVLSAMQGGKLQQFRKQFLQEFLNKYFPAKEKSLPQNLLPSVSYAHLEGAYRPNLLSPLTVEKLGNLALDTFVKDNGDASISVFLPPYRARLMRLIEVAPNLFRSESGTFVAFHEGKMFLSGELADPIPFVRLRWYESGFLYLALFAFGSLVYGLVCAVSIFLLVKRLFRRRVCQQVANNRSRVRKFAALTSWLYILSPILTIVYYLVGDAEQRPFKVETALTIGISFLLIAAVSGVFTSALIFKEWKETARRERFFLALFATVCLGAIPLMAYWNLLGYNF